MDPMYLEEVEQQKGGGPWANAIEGMRAAGLDVPQIMHLFAYKTDRTEHLARFTQGVMRGPSPLAPGMRELIAAFTSRRNDCPFWIGSHAAVAAELLGDRALVDTVLEDYRTAPVDERHKALFGFIEKMNQQSNRIRRDDIDRLKEAGWTEEAIYDAITVCALFRFYNAWIDATGVHDLPAAAYKMSGKRMAEQGYMR